MINLIQAPYPGRIVADGNDTIIKINSTYGQERYFRVHIYVDGDLFYDQIWSKDENNEVNFNLRHLYYNYFPKEFRAVGASKFHALDLKRRVVLVIREHDTFTGQEKDEIILPAFYIIKSGRPQYFTDSRNIRMLDFDVDVYKVAQGAAIRVPIFVKPVPQLTVELRNPAGQAVYFDNHGSISDETVGYVDISHADVPETYPYLTLVITAGNQGVRQEIEVVRSTRFPVKSVYYENNFGIFCLAHLFGKQIVEHKLKPESYQDQDGRNVNFEIEDEQNFEINTGWALVAQTKLHRAIATSLDIRMRKTDIIYPNAYFPELAFQAFFAKDVNPWLKVVSETKKLLVLEDDKSTYENVLKFSRLNIIKEESIGYMSPPKVSDFTVTGSENQQKTIAKQLFLDNFDSDFPAEKIRIIAPPENGTYGRNLTNDDGVVVDLGFIAGNPNPVEFLIDNFNHLFYNPTLESFGSPNDVLQFQIFNGYMWSNLGALRINILSSDDPLLDAPLITSTNDNPFIDINAFGWGKVNLGVNVSFFGGQGGTYDWGVPIGVLYPNDLSFDPNDVVENPFIRVDNPMFSGKRVVELKATDNFNGETSTRVFEIQVNKYALVIDYQPIGSDDVSITYEIKITGGKPGESVDVFHDYYGNDLGQYAEIIPKDSYKEMLSDRFRKKTRQFTFDENGTFSYMLKMNDYNQSNLDEVNIRLISASGEQTISETNQITIKNDPVA